MDSANPKRPDFDERTITIGDLNDSTDQIPRTDVYLCRTSPLGSPGADLTRLSFTNAGIDVSLNGLTRQDLVSLIGFFAEYEQRMREF